VSRLTVKMISGKLPPSTETAEQRNPRTGLPGQETTGRYCDCQR
jgi:hypothetical protein